MRSARPSRSSPASSVTPSPSSARPEPSTASSRPTPSMRVHAHPSPRRPSRFCVHVDARAAPRSSGGSRSPCRPSARAGRLRGILAVGGDTLDQAAQQVVTGVVALAGLALEQTRATDAAQSPPEDGRLACASRGRPRDRRGRGGAGHRSSAEWAGASCAVHGRPCRTRPQSGWSCIPPASSPATATTSWCCSRRGPHAESGWDADQLPSRPRHPVRPARRRLGPGHDRHPPCRTRPGHRIP